MTKPVDYDAIAGDYDRRYDRNDYDGVRREVAAFVGATPERSVLEVGCGTGHWLREVVQAGGRIVGVDRSWNMLERAIAREPGALLVQGRAETLPFSPGSFECVLCINALHHFSDVDVFVAEVRRVLQPGGGILVVGLDPHAGDDRWWIYDAFPAALEADRQRYPATHVIRHALVAAGFRECATRVAQHMPAAVPFRTARALGMLDRSSTSQLMVIDDEAYERGIAGLQEAQASLGDADLLLHADLRLYATTGWLLPVSRENEGVAEVGHGLCGPR
jgi:ubiquinone/menaquinone biosynthesis C-methylase UbiE